MSFHEVQFPHEVQSPVRRSGPLRRWALRLGIAAELLRFLARTGRFWLLPMMVVFLLAAIVLGAVQVLEYVAPFVYTMF